MRPLVLLAVFGAIAVTGCEVDGTVPHASVATPGPAPATATLAADAVRTVADGEPKPVAFTTGARVVVQPLRITGRKAGVVAGCAVRIEGREIATIGAAGSATETLICHRLVELGALPAVAGRRRLGLIYNAGSPKRRVPATGRARGSREWRLGGR